MMIPREVLLLAALVSFSIGCAANAQPSPAPCASAEPAANGAPATDGVPVARDDEHMRVAITFDDLPAHGPARPGESIVDIHRRILEVLASHGIDSAYGFVNGAMVGEHAEGRKVLEMWRDAGHPLGNHTWSHVDLDQVGAEKFIAEIDQNDRLLAEIVGDDEAGRRSRRVFRYPYLRQGRDQAVLDAVREHLAAGGYRNAEVTVDFGDWAYNPPFVRCVERGDEGAIEAIRFDFVRRGVAFLRWSEATGRALYGEPIPHVLLLHSGSLDAVALDELLTSYEKAGATWITLDEAFDHPAYREDLRVPSRWGGTLLEQRIERDAPSHPPFMLQPLGLLEHLCR